MGPVLRVEVPDRVSARKLQDHAFFVALLMGLSKSPRLPLVVKEGRRWCVYSCSAEQYARLKVEGVRVEDLQKYREAGSAAHCFDLVTLFYHEVLAEEGITRSRAIYISKPNELELIQGEDPQWDLSETDEVLQAKLKELG